MIPKSVLETLKHLVEAIEYAHATGSSLHPDVREVREAKDVLLQPLEPTEARAVEPHIDAAIDILHDLNVDDNEGNVQAVAARIGKCYPELFLLEHLPKKWMDEANERFGNPLELTMSAQQRLDADELCKALTQARRASPLTKADLNAITGMTDFEINRVDGDQDGKGLPTAITISRGELAARYVPESSPQPEAATIDAEALAKEIANAIPWGDGTPDERLARRDGYARIIAPYLRKHASEHAGEQGWVKCSDELPPIGEEVVCFVPNATVGHPVRALVRLLRHEDGPEYYWNTSCNGNHHIASAVTHWHREPAAPDSAGGKK